MTRHLGRTVAAAALAGLLGAAWAAVFYAWRPVLDADFGTDPPRLLAGVYPAERDPQSNLTFAWTRDEVTLRLPGIDRRVPWTLAMRVRGGRANNNPSIDVLADGLPCGTIETAADFQDVRVGIPARPERRRGLTVTLHVSSTFVPGASDPRALGVMLDRLSLAPDGIVLAPRAALVGAALASAAMGAALGMLGITAGSAIVAALLVSAGAAGIIVRGFGAYTAFPFTAAWLAVWVGAALAVGAYMAGRASAQRLRNTAKFAAAFTAAALFLKLLVLLHPDMAIGDAMFHAHRYQLVLRGTLLFTSIAPGGYSFPYAPGLYVFSALFAPFVRHGAADMALLRIVVSSVDAAAALLLYRAVAVAWSDRLAGAIAVALYHLTPLDFAVVTTGNLTNAFAQSLAVAALAMMAARPVRLERRGAVAALALLLAAAYLSHTSTLAILFAATVAIAALFVLRGGPALRSAAWAILAATLAAAVFATAIYYAHFMETYRTEFVRIGRETASAARTAGNRTLSDRVAFVPYGLRVYFGIPLLVLAAAGAWWQYARGAADRLSLTVAGWLIACGVFLAIGVLTPVDMRYYLAAVPAIALLASRGASRAWDEGGYWRGGAAVALGWIAWTGIQAWWEAVA